MISHYLVLGSFLVGIPQGVYLAVKISNILGVTRPVEICMVIAGCFLGIFLGYIEISAIKKVFPRKE